VSTDLRLLCVLAHPDDESLGTGGILAKYAAEGVATYLLTATRGERGRIGTERPGPAIVGPVREAELRRAVEVLGLSELHLLDYVDGDLDRADPHEATSKIAAHLRRIRPQVVVTFGADGAYGHIDHVAISQFTGAAIVAAADPAFVAPPEVDLPAEPHAVDKLYWMSDALPTWRAYEHAFGELIYRVDGVERRPSPWPDWMLTTFVDTRAHSRTIWRAVECHQSQISGYARLLELEPDDQAALWNVQTYYRVFSRVNGGREREDDLFAGLR
jgi:LmbE family N-acetylglucosaminyl deacetylase